MHKFDSLADLVMFAVFSSRRLKHSYLLRLLNSSKDQKTGQLKNGLDEVVALTGKAVNREKWEDAWLQS